MRCKATYMADKNLTGPTRGKVLIRCEFETGHSGARHHGFVKGSHGVSWPRGLPPAWLIRACQGLTRKRRYQVYKRFSRDY